MCKHTLVCRVLVFLEHDMNSTTWPVLIMVWLTCEKKTAPDFTKTQHPVNFPNNFVFKKMNDFRCDNVWKSVSWHFHFHAKLKLKVETPDPGDQELAGKEVNKDPLRWVCLQKLTSIKAYIITSKPSHWVEGKGGDKLKINPTVYFGLMSPEDISLQVPPFYHIISEEEKNICTSGSSHRASVCMSLKPTAFNTCGGTDLNSTHTNSTLLLKLRFSKAKFWITVKNNVTQLCCVLVLELQFHPHH